jgi:hypothetical protein
MRIKLFTSGFRDCLPHAQLTGCKVGTQITCLCCWVVSLEKRCEGVHKQMFGAETQPDGGFKARKYAGNAGIWPVTKAALLLLEDFTYSGIYENNHYIQKILCPFYCRNQQRMYTVRMRTSRRLDNCAGYDGSPQAPSLPSSLLSSFLSPLFRLSLPSRRLYLPFQPPLIMRYYFANLSS